MALEEIKLNISNLLDYIALFNLTEIKNNSQLPILKKSIVYLKDIKQFLGKNENIVVLENFIKESKSREELLPLDNLISSIIKGLTEINSLLKNDNYILNIIKNQNINTLTPNLTIEFTNSLKSINQKIENHLLIKLLSVFNILKHLNGHNKTLIIIGPNGSGKTSFANYLKNLENHIKVIPANKPLLAIGNIPNYYQSKFQDYNNELYNNTTLSNELLQKLIIAICSEHDDIARKYLATDIKEESKYQKIKTVFDSFFDVKLSNDSFGDKKILATKNNGLPFEFNKMSDGERAGFFYIATVITAPENSFIIVDEPENHLNPAIYNKIWDTLINLRKDCQFIFISHTIDFIISRSNYELVKIKKFSPPNDFEFDFLGDSLSDIPREYIVEIIGSQKPILFCEGSKKDYDYQIYENIFGRKYTIIPVGNCITVKNSVIGCNQLSQNYSIQPAIGIIDSDLKSDEQIEDLKSKNIFPLKCTEIEMLLLDEFIFKKVLAHLFEPEETFNAFKESFFKKLTERKEHIIRRFVKTKIEESLHSIIIDDKINDTKQKLTTELKENFKKINVEEIWNNFEKELNQILECKEYDEALRYCCLQHNEILGGITNKYIKDYSKIALGLLGTDKDLSSQIKNKYFSDIPTD